MNALKFYNKCIQFSKKTGNKLSLSSALVNIGGIKSQQSKSKEANSLLSKSKQIRDSLNIQNHESALSLFVIKEKILDSRFNEAKEDLLKLKKVYENNPNEKEGLLETYYCLISTYGYLNEPDSVSFYTNKSSNLQVEILETKVMQTNRPNSKPNTKPPKKKSCCNKKKPKPNKKA